jgi:hypothetical protein
VSQRFSKMLAAGAIALGLMAAAPAHAQMGYVCSVYWLPQQAAAFGNIGIVGIGIYNGPACTGGYVSTKYWCGDGSTSTSCPSSEAYQLTEAQLNALYQNANNAIAHEMPISWSDVNCNGGARTCAGHLNFYAKFF